MLCSKKSCMKGSYGPHAIRSIPSSRGGGHLPTQRVVFRLRIARAYCREFPHRRPDVGLGSHLSDQLPELTFGLVCRAPQDRAPVLTLEQRRQQADTAEVQSSVAEHGQEHRVLAGRARHVDAEPGLGLGEMEDLDTPGEHRGHRFARPESPRIDLGDVGNEVRLDAPGLTQKIGQASEQLVVRDILQIGFLSHGESLGGSPDRSGPLRGRQERSCTGRLPGRPVSEWRRSVSTALDQRRRLDRRVPFRATATSLVASMPYSPPSRSPYSLTSRKPAPSRRSFSSCPE